MVQAVPGSLSEGAAERSEAEGVYPDERNRSKISEFICTGEETIGPEQPSNDTPSVSFADSSLREGAGNGCGGLHHPTGCLRNRGGAGDFHRPYEGRVTFIEVHSLSLAFARQLPQGGSRDGAFAIYRGTR